MEEDWRAVRVDWWRVAVSVEVRSSLRLRLDPPIFYC